MIDIKYYENGTLKIKSVQEDDGSFRYRAIMGDDSITLKFTLAEAIEFPVGTFVEFQGSTYTLTSPENWSRYGNQNIEYTMLLNGVSATLGKYKLRNLQDNRLKFSMCTTPSEFLDLIVDNLNQSGRSTGWTAQCNIDVSEQKTIEFNHTYLIDALKSIADTFKTEYEITSSKVIKLGKVEYNKTHPLPLAYGAGNGFKAGTGRANSNESKPVEILYVQGGERNIDRSKYGSAELHLPKGQTLEYEGRTYISDEDGLSIRRYGVEPKYGNEDSFDGSEIYPKHIGTVSAVTVVDAEAHFYDFADNSIPNDLDYNDVLIDGETMTVIFQTGMLAGREFEISKYAHADRTFEIVPQEIDGIQMPDNTWKPVVGDTYIIYGCTLPDAYIVDNDTKTGAEWDLFREAARNMYENEDFKFTFSGELQGKWAKENWDNVGGKLIIGGYIKFSDTHFAPQGIDIRITGIKEFLGDPYSPIIEISNSIVSAGVFESALREASNQDVKIGEVLSNSLSFTKRRFRDAQEAINMLEAAFGDKFSKGINPVSIQTMAMLVGDERLQFKVYDTSFTSIIAFPATFSNGTLTIQACGIRHFSLGITDTAITTSRSEDSYKKWAMPAQQLTPSDAASAYYLYAKVSRTSSSSASFELSTEVKTIDGTSGYYYLLVGVLSSMSDDGTRSLAPLFGYTEILPNQILTGSVRSADGNTVFDLETGILSLNSNSSVMGQGAGINGNPSLSDIAAWFGGPMADKEATPTQTNNAASLFRFDGTGYLAKGNITWDANGYGQVGGSGDRYAIKWNDNGIFLGSGIKITESGQETLATLLEAVTELQSWFGKDDSGDIYIKNDENGRARGFYTNSFLSAGGKGESSSGGGSADYTQWGWDDIIQLTSDPGMGNLASAWALKQEYDSRQSALSVLSQGLSSIRLLIPSSASESNQLADKEFVNSSIASNTATFRGTFEGVSYLPSGAKLNDYAFVIATDASGNPEYNRYKYTASGWVFEYTLNNSSFTAEQWSAITSGITANLVSLYSGHIANKSNPHGVTASQIGALTKHQDIYTLTLKVNGAQVGTYKANDKDVTISIADVASKNALEAHIANQSNPHAVTKAQIGLGDVENIKLSSWAGSTNITTLGAVTTGEWKASKIANDYLVNSSIQIGSTKVSLGGAIEALSGIESISLKGNNDAKLYYDNGAWHLSGNLLVDGYITAGGVGSSSGSGGIDSAAMWALLGDATGEQINKTHISSALEGYQAIIPDLATIRSNAANGNTAYGYFSNGKLPYTSVSGAPDLSDMATKTWVNVQGYLKGITSSMVTSALGYTPYNAANIGSASVAYATSAGNADTLDGYHKNDITRYDGNISSAFSLNKRVIYGGIDITSWDLAHSSYVNNQPGGDGAASAASVYTFGGMYPIQIYSDYNNTNYLFFRSYYTNTGWKAWRRFAFLDSNVASASKWATPRTITLTGSVTGSVSIDGSGDVSLATTTNHTHTFASLTSKPNTISGYGIIDALTTANYNSYAPTLTGGGASGTWEISISGNAGSTSTFGGTTSDYYFQDRGAFIGGADWNSYGINGATTVNEFHWAGANTPPASYKYGLLVSFKGSTTKCQIYFPHTPTEELYTRISWDGTDVQWTGWKKIALTSSNVASATKLQTARTIWGQSFNGTENVSGAISGATTISASGQISSSVADGTAPFVVASTTMVNNLNVQYLDGRRGTTYMYGRSQGAYNADSQYNFGYWAVANGSNLPSSAQYGSLLVLPYRNIDANNHPDYTAQIFIPNGDDGQPYMFYRTSHVYSWDAWVKVWGTNNAGAGYDWACKDLNASGNILASGAITAGTASDSRLKSNIATLVNASSVLRQLRGVGFDWNTLATDKSSYFKGHDVGLIAQEVEPLIPSAIGTIWGEYKRLDYTKITPYLVEGWKEHDTEINRLRNRVSELESEVNKLRKYVN